jgi:hypothetical protein
MQNAIDTTPAAPAASQAPDQAGGRWTLIQALRREADHHLEVIAFRIGPDSRLHRRCRDVWGDWEREALTSIMHGDFANAEVLLDRGVHALRHALDLAQKDRLTEDDLLALIAAA